ncbi:uncharacterized protein LOC129759569 [Uranotaenia lowii]|uniref:uncharacterized protein LOC129759569 n=1 Tax=Uranotaenia lowii TaxID=190385 RepID=UPI00247B2DA6|nr:uncharacterized protein LOC129759569 [Uranotaenia lowii]
MSEFTLQYRSLNVNHLLDDELEHELTIRAVKFTSGESRDVKRRKLRNAMKQQRETNHFELLPVEENARESEFNLIDEKIAKIRDMLDNRRARKSMLAELKTRLIHLYFRLIRLKLVFNTQNLEAIPLMLLNDHFSFLSNDPSLAAETSRRTLEYIEQLRDFDIGSDESRNEEEEEEKEESDEEEIANFEKDRRITFRNRSEEIDSSTPKRTLENKQELSRDFSLSDVAELISEKLAEFKMEIFETQDRDKKLNQLKKKPINREIGKADRGLKSNKKFTPTHSDSSENESIYAAKTLKRRPRPVTDWKLRYDGRDEGRHLNRFITEIEFLSEAEGISKETLFHESIHLFAGDARSWFIEGKKNRQFRSWNELVAELKLEFQPPEMDFNYEQQAVNRRQKRGEKFQDFYNALMEIFGRMADPPTEERIFQIMFRNLRADYKNSLVVKGVRTLHSLRVWGRKLDSVNWFMYKNMDQAPRQGQLHEISQYPSQKQQTSNGRDWKGSGYQKSADWRNSGRSDFKVQNYDQRGQTRSKFQDQRRPEPRSYHSQPNAQEGNSRTSLEARIANYRVPDRNAEIEELIIRVEGDNRPFARVDVMGVQVVGLLDCGAQMTVLGVGSRKLLDDLKLKQYPTNIKLSTAGGTALNVTGIVDLPMMFNGETKLISTVVAPNLSRRLVLGMNFWKSFGIEPSVSRIEEIAYEENEEPEVGNEELLSSIEKHRLEEVKKKFKVYKEGERLDATPLMTHSIEFTEEFKDAPPIRMNPYPWSPEVQKAVDEELNKWIDAGVVEQSHSDWAMLIVPVVKKEESSDSKEGKLKVRMCIDARKLNARTRRDAYPLPHQDRILSRLGPAKYLSTIDLSKAFWQIPLDPNSRKYTAFRVFGRGLFQFTRLGMGLVNSAAVLSRLMDQVLGYGELEPNVFVYLDDIVIVSNTFEEHLRSLEEVARRLKAANLSINLEKSKFAVSELPYLGFILSEKGFRPNPDKIEAIVNFERPTSVRSLRRFLGMVNYYRRFIDNFSEKTALLTDLLKGKPKVIQWNADADQAFSVLKEKLITAPILANPDFQKPFTIQTDASDTALAGVLTQENDGKEHVVAYFSRKLTMTQRSWKAAEKEGAAAMEAIEKFRPYVEGTRFTLITDSSALSFIMNSKWKPSSKLSRWSMLLQQYDMVIRHRKGSENVVPDAISRAVESIDTTKQEWYPAVQ